LDLRCLGSIILGEPCIDGKRVTSKVTLTHLDGTESGFELQISYEGQALEKYLPLYRLATTMPLLNYGLFADEIRLDFEISESDLDLLNDLLDVFSKDIFVNKLVRRRTRHLDEKSLPKDDEVTEENARPLAKMRVKNVSKDNLLVDAFDKNKCGILSSGGKEALLTYSMLKEAGAEAHPLYVNESGGHWRTALTAYRWHSRTEPNTGRVWTNVDRFYTFMLDNLRIVNYAHRRIPGDTYPIRLCIFPVYVFMLLPVFAERRIGNLLIGSEFDDPRGEWTLRGIRHYFGIYDQHQDFDARMADWYAGRMPGMRQWSAVRSISGLVVERILTSKYPEVAESQRSCHSCHFEGDDIIPCGRCTKCLGVLLFLLANGADPGRMGYPKADIDAFATRLKDTAIRLDPDEYEHSRYLAKANGIDADGNSHPHIEGVHIHPPTSDPGMVPESFRDKLDEIIVLYTNGRWILRNGEWYKAN